MYVNELKKYLTRSLNKDCILSCFEQIHSTNDFLLNQPNTNKPHICISNHQTHGKGQHGRIWKAQQGSSLLLSLKYPFNTNTNLSGLSLAVGLSIITTLNQYFNNSNANLLKLKWPNDVYYQNKKLAGILIENQVQGNEIHSVIGLGINIALSQDFSCDKPFIDLQTILDKTPDKNSFCVSIINQLLLDIAVFEADGFIQFLPRWQSLDYLSQAKITLINGTTYQANGINHLGGLQLLGQQNQVLYDSAKIKNIRVNQ